MESKSGSFGGYLLGVGLFSAGFTSSVTAPLAAAITAGSLFHKNDSRWRENRVFYNGIWLLVVVAGFLFGISGVKPIPAIILAQAVNGLLLPVATIFLVIIVNDTKIIPPQHLNPRISNYLLLGVVMVTSFLGLVSISKVIFGLLNLQGQDLPFTILLIVSLLIMVWIYFFIRKIRVSD